MGAKVGSGSSGYHIGRSGGAGTSGQHDDGYRRVNGYSTELNRDSQGKHIPGHKNYQPDRGRSIFKGSLADAQGLVEEFAGKGTWHGEQRETVDFGKVIGTWVSQDGSERLPTTRGTIHYGKNGAHIVPSKPEGADDGN